MALDRRGFLRFLGMGVAAAVAPTKAYSFLGGILRPRLAIPRFGDVVVFPANLVVTGTITYRKSWTWIGDGVAWTDPKNWQEC